MKPGEEPGDACAFVVGYAHERHTPICKRIRAALDRRGEEERAKALEAAAREADAIRDEQTQVWEENGGEEGTPAFYLDGRKPTDEEWIRQGDRMGGAGGADAAEEIARRIRSIAAAPSGDAKEPAKPVCPECGGRGWPTALDSCATCHGDPLPAGDAKGTP